MKEHIWLKGTRGSAGPCKEFLKVKKERYFRKKGKRKMKKLVAILVVAAILLLGAGSVLAGGDKVQMENPGFNQEPSDHNAVNHCFQNIND